jgi:diacylglycerol O-acyltransferase
MHHSLIDGVSGMKLLQRAMSADRAKSMQMPPFWSSGASNAGAGSKNGRKAALPSLSNAAAMAIDALKEEAHTVPKLVMAFAKFVSRIGKSDDGLAIPFDSPRSALNGRVREKRRFATQQFSLDRIRAVATAADCTLNDVVLALCSGALRRFLLENDALPGKSLTTGIPVSVRPKDDEGSGNAISFIVATLGTNIADAAERLEAIKVSVKHAKAHVQSLPKQAMTQYTMMLLAPTLITMLTGTGGRTRPMFNITISNVPGPDKPLYFRGAELLATYPASIVTHGQALNITCQSYAGTMNFGFTGCHTSVPSLQHLAVYAEEALQELEKAVKKLSKPARPVRKAAPRKAAPKKPNGAKATATAEVSAPRKRPAARKLQAT